MKIVKNTSDKLVSNLTKSAAGESDSAYQSVMNNLNEVESLVQTIDPSQYPQYLKDIWNKMNAIHHTLGGTMQTQQAPINPNAAGPIEPTDNPVL